MLLTGGLIPLGMGTFNVVRFSDIHEIPTMIFVQKVSAITALGLKPAVIETNFSLQRIGE